MFDHILMFADEAAARAALGPLGYGREARQMISADVVWAWDTSRVLPGVEMVLANAVWNHSDPMRPLIVTPKQTLSGYYVAISLAAPDEVLKGLPGAPCRIIASSAAAAAGLPFLVYLAPDLNPAALAAIIRVEPTLAGREYDFARLAA